MLKKMVNSKTVQRISSITTGMDEIFIQYKVFNFWILIEKLN